jgi:arylsulfatase A-like enzyme
MALFVIASRLPMAFGASPAALGLGAGAALGLVAWAFSQFLLTGGGAWRDPAKLAIAGTISIISIPAAAIAAASVTPLVTAIGIGLSSGKALPRPLTVTIEACLVACVVVSALSLDFSAGPSKIDYKTLAAPGKPAGPNVVLITIDTQRADHLGCYGYNRPTSPFIDSLASSGVVFDDFTAAAPWTKPSTATILTGLYPSRHGALYHGSELNTPDGMKTLAETFRDKGYVTAGFVSNPNIKKIFKFDRGFQEFFDSPVEDTVTMATFRDSLFGGILKALTKYQFNWKYRNDCTEVNRHVVAWLEKNRTEKFFLYLHYIDPHEPYSPPADYEAQFRQNHGTLLHNERKRRMGIDLYDGEIRYTDDNLRKLADTLKQYGLWENTLFVITSDHGEEFFEHGILGHGFSLYQEVLRIPLILSGPGVPGGIRVAAPHLNVDLAATVLDAAGTGIEELGDGKSFFGALRDRNGSNNKKPVREKLFLEDEFGENDQDTRSFVMSGVRAGRFKLILNERHAYRPPENPKYPKQELYDLDADPGELHNLFKDPSRKDTIQSLLDALLKHSHFLSEKGLRPTKPPALSDDQQRELRNIGYLK